jgi:hypothetical protein
VINGSKFTTYGLNMGFPYSNDKTRTGARIVFAVTNSTVESLNDIGFSHLRLNGGVAQILASNATINADQFTVSGNTDSRISASTLSSRNGQYARLTGDCYGGGSILFDKGTLLKINDIKFNHSAVQYARMVTFAFDDATWDTGANGIVINETTFPKYVDIRRFEMRGKGLTLQIAQDSTFETDALFYGNGNLVKTGGGTLKFGNGAFAVNGTVRCNEGVVDFSQAGEISNTILAGSGTFRGGNFRSKVFIDPSVSEECVNGELPVLDGCSFLNGALINISLEVADKLADELEDGLPVARFKNSNLNIASWRLPRSWPRANQKAFFSVDGDTVKMKISNSGVFLIVR